MVWTQIPTDIDHKVRLEGGLLGGSLEFASGSTEVEGEQSLRWQSKAQWPPLKHTLQVCSNLHRRIEQAPLLKRQHGSQGKP